MRTNSTSLSSLSNYAKSLERNENALGKATNDLKNVLQSTKSHKSVLSKAKNMSLTMETRALRKEAKALVKTAEKTLTDRNNELADIYHGDQPESIKLGRELYGGKAVEEMSTHLDEATQNLISNLRDKAQQLKNLE